MTVVMKAHRGSVMPLENLMDHTFLENCPPTPSLSTNKNHKELQRTANEYAGEHRIYKELISKKKNNVDILNSASRILQC